MQMLVASPDTPDHNQLFFNCEEQLANLLLFFQRKGPAGADELISADSVIVSGSQKIIAQKLLLHASHILPELVGRRVELIWLSVYAGADFREVGGRLHAYLAERWAGDSGGVENAELAKVLSFEVSGLESPEMYAKDNLYPLLSIFPSSHIICVLDLFGLPSFDANSNTGGLQDIWSLLIALRKRAKRIDVDVVAIGHFPGRDGHKLFAGARRIDLPHLPQTVIDLLENERPSATKTVARKSIALETLLAGHHADYVTPRDHPELVQAMRFLHPLVALHQPASKMALSCLQDINDPELQNIWNRIKTEFLDPTQGKCLTVNQRGFGGYESLEKSGINAGPIYSDNIPNAAKLYSLQTPDRFITLDSSIEDLHRYLNERGRLVDHCAAGIAARLKGHDFADDVFAILSAFSKRSNVAFQETSIKEGQIVLCFLSQLLLTERYGLGRDVFEVLESLTFGFNDFLRLGGSSDIDAAFAGAGWVKNLGYIYDKNPHLSTGTINKYANNERKRYAAKAAEFLSDIDAKGLEDYSNIIYHRGWETDDAGDSKTAVNLFLDTGLSILDRQTPEPTGQLHEEFAFELCIQAMVFGNVGANDNRVSRILDRMLSRYGLLMSGEDVACFLNNGSHLWVPIAPEIIGQEMPRAAILFSIYDLATALAMASFLVFRWGTAVELISCRDKDASAETIEALISQMPEQRYLIAGPTTPHGIGKLVSKFLLPLERLFQFERIARHPYFTDVESLGVTLLTGRGICGPLDAWHAWLAEQHAKPKRNSIMWEALVLNSFFYPILRKARDKVAELVIDSLTDIVRKKVSNNGCELNPMDSDTLRSDLKRLSEHATRPGANDRLTEEEIRNLVPQSQYQDRRVPTAIVTGLAPRALPTFIGTLRNQLVGVGIKPEDVSMLSELGLEMCRFVEERTSRVDTETDEMLEEYRISFLDIGKKANKISWNYRRGREMRYDILNELSSRLARALRTLEEDVREVAEYFES